jgi:hypothetical protein
MYMSIIKGFPDSLHITTIPVTKRDSKQHICDHPSGNVFQLPVQGKACFDLKEVCNYSMKMMQTMYVS